MKRVLLILSFLSFIYANAFSLKGSAPENVIQNVRVSRTHFNPSIGQSLDFSFEISQPGRIDVFVLDRDGFVIRQLVAGREVSIEKITVQWDGSDAKTIVPNEAYSFKIDWGSGGRKETYFPANKQQKSIFLKATYYDRQRRLLLYTLTLPSRMHIHASSGKMNANGEFEGAVLKTLVDREPRVAGAVQEAWDGMDESRTIYVPDLPYFGISISAQPLPENAVITIGNKAQLFIDYASKRKGQSQLIVQKKGSDHKGLDVYQDLSPKLKLDLQGAEWSEKEKSWLAKNNNIKVNGMVVGPSAKYFVEYPGELKVFVDGKKIYSTKNPVSPFTIDIPATSLEKPEGVVFNWDTEYGPIAIGAFRLKQVIEKNLESSR